MWYNSKLTILSQLLEQLMGSQSLAGTIERFFTLGRCNAIGVLILALWLLSPFGSQMTLRLLEFGDSQITSNPQIQYFNTTCPTTYLDCGSSFESASGFDSDQAALTSLMGANILSSQTVAKSFVDTWNNVKIPLLDEISSPNGNLNNPWIDVNENSNLSWASINGIMTQGLPATGASTFSLESSYLVASCPNSIRLPTDNLPTHLKSAGINLTIQNTTYPWSTNTASWNSMFLDTSIITNNLTNFTIPSTPTAPLSLIFGSLIGNDADSPGLDSGPNIDIFSCNLTTAYVEANITCTGPSCKATQLRHSEKDRTSPFSPPFLVNTYKSLLSFIPQSLGLPDDATASAPDQYLLGSNAPLSLSGSLYATGGYANVPGPAFARRLTTLLNTAWQASLCPYGIALGSATNFTACQLGVDGPEYTPFATANATTMTTVPNAVYVTNIWHAVLLLLITALLQLVALGSVALGVVTRAPNVLGFVSSLTRDSPFFAGVVPEGGSGMGGGERARVLGDVRVRLADVRAGEAVGRVAFVGIEGGSGEGMGRLRKGRAYE